MSYSESELQLDSNFAINSVSDFDSDQFSFYEFAYPCFFGLYLRSSRKNCR